MNVLTTYLAAGLTAIWAIVHIVIGGREVEAPLRRDRTQVDVVRVTMILTSHYVSATLIILAAMFAIAGLLVNAALLWCAVSISGLFSLIGLVLAPGLGVGYRTLPQGWLFVPVTLWGLAALI